MGQFRLDHRAKRFVVDVRGKLLSFAPFDMPVIQHGERQGVRYRLASFLGEGHDIVAVSDAAGVEAIEVHAAMSLVGAVPEAAGEHAGGEHAEGEHAGPGDGALPAFRRIEVPGLGRVVELVPSPDGSQLAVTNHENQLLIVSVAAGNARLLDESAFGRPAGPVWSPDGRWVAYSFPASPKSRWWL
jgi:tricorn protease